MRSLRAWHSWREVAVAVALAAVAVAATVALLAGCQRAASEPHPAPGPAIVAPGGERHG